MIAAHEHRHRHDRGRYRATWHAHPHRHAGSAPALELTAAPPFRPRAAAVDRRVHSGAPHAHRHRAP